MKNTIYFDLGKKISELSKGTLFSLPEWKLKERRGTNKNIINLPKEKRYDPDGFFSLPKSPFQLLALDLKKGSRIGYKVRSFKSHQFKDIKALMEFMDPHYMENIEFELRRKGQWEKGPFWPGIHSHTVRDYVDSSIKNLRENYSDNILLIQEVLDKPLIVSHNERQPLSVSKTDIILPGQITSISHRFLENYYAGSISGSYELKTQFTMPDNRSIRFYLKCKHHDSKSIEIYFGVEDKNSLITFNRPARVDLEVKNAIYNNLEKLSEIVSGFPPSCDTESLSINARLLNKSLEDQIKYL